MSGSAWITRHPYITVGLCTDRPQHNRNPPESFVNDRDYESMLSNSDLAPDRDLPSGLIPLSERHRQALPTRPVPLWSCSTYVGSVPYRAYFGRLMRRSNV